MESQYLNPQDRARMQYYLKEMKEKFIKYPNSLCLRNGIHAVETKLGIPVTVSPICPLEFLRALTKEEMLRDD
jgi:hypothetical protein